jgi:hypothetical protein
MALKLGSGTLLAKVLARATGASSPRRGNATLTPRAKLLATGTLHKVSLSGAPFNMSASIGAAGRVVKTGSATLRASSPIGALGVGQRIALTFHLDPTTIPTQAIEGG